VFFSCLGLPFFFFLDVFHELKTTKVIKLQLGNIVCKQSVDLRPHSIVFIYVEFFFFFFFCALS
jgi:hypothetical protein